MSDLNKAVLAATLLSVALLTAGINQANAETASSATDPVLAVVGDTLIKHSDYQAYLQQISSMRQLTGSPEERMVIIDELVNRELIYQESLKLGLDKKPEVAREIANQRREFLVSAGIRAHMESVKISDEVLRKEYDTRVAAMTSKEYRARHILVKTEKEAKAIIGKLDKGTDFAKLAKDKSLDTGSAKNGGDLNWFEPAQMVKPFGDALKELEKGAYTKSPVQSQFGWHIIKLEDTREIKPPEFDKVKDNLRNILLNREIKVHLAELKANAKIEIKEVQEDKSSAASQAPAATGAK